MGKRDFKQREVKKTKKDSRKISAPSIMPPPATVEVIRKGKKSRDE